MKLRQLIVASLCLMLMGACGMNNENGNNANANSQKNDNSSGSSMQDMGNAVSSTIDDMMKYFKEMGLEFSEMTNIENMDFAAHEGRMLVNNGQKAYLYRLNNQDPAMQKLMEQVRDKGMADVKIDNEQKQYSAMVNGDYLLLYDQGANLSNLTSIFPNFKMSTSGKDPKEVNPDTSSGRTTTPNSPDSGSTTPNE